jgi:hypothetical protein
MGTHLLMNQDVLLSSNIPGEGRIEPADCLGLVLVLTRTRGPLNVLQLVFGLTFSNFSIYLRFGIRLIVEIFHDDPIT